jgi:hypothetical protein
MRHVLATTLRVLALLAPAVSAALLPAASARSAAASPVKLAPPARGMYHVAYPDFVLSED